MTATQVPRPCCWWRGCTCTGYRVLPAGLDEEELNAAVKLFTTCFVRGVADLPAPLLPLIVKEALPTAIALFGEAVSAENPVRLAAAASLWQRIVNALRRTIPAGPRCLYNLGMLRFACFDAGGTPADLDAAVEGFRAAVAATPPRHADRAAFLFVFGDALRVRFEQSGAQADLDAAAVAVRRASTLPRAGIPTGRCGWPASAASSRRARYGPARGKTLTPAVAAGQRAVDAMNRDEPRRAEIRSALADALMARFERFAARADLDAAIEACRAAADGATASSKDRAKMLSNLGVALRIRFWQAGALDDLEAGLEAFQAALDAATPGHRRRPVYLSNLGDALQARSVHTGSRADLDAAILLDQAAVEAVPAGDPHRARFLANLGNALLTRFTLSGVPADLDAAITAGQAAVETTHADEPRRSQVAG